MANHQGIVGDLNIASFIAKAQNFSRLF